MAELPYRAKLNKTVHAFIKNFTIHDVSKEAASAYTEIRTALIKKSVGKCRKKKTILLL